MTHIIQIKCIYCLQGDGQKMRFIRENQKLENWTNKINLNSRTEKYKTKVQTLNKGSVTYQKNNQALKDMSEENFQK